MGGQAWGGQVWGCTAEQLAQSPGLRRQEQAPLRAAQPAQSPAQPRRHACHARHTRAPTRTEPAARAAAGCTTTAASRCPWCATWLARCWSRWTTSTPSATSSTQARPRAPCMRWWRAEAVRAPGPPPPLCCASAWLPVPPAGGPIWRPPVCSCSCPASPVRLTRPFFFLSFPCPACRPEARECDAD